MPTECSLRVTNRPIHNDQENELYIVFEWAEHGDLRRLIRRVAESSTHLHEVQIWAYFTQAPIRP